MTHWIDDLLREAGIVRVPPATDLGRVPREKDLWAMQWPTEKLLVHCNQFMRAVSICVHELRDRGMSDADIMVKMRELGF